MKTAKRSVRQNKRRKRSKIGNDLVEGFELIAAHLRGEIELESYELRHDESTPQRVKAIPSKHTHPRK
jgi:hypothetical protein